MALGLTFQGLSFLTLEMERTLSELDSVLRDCDPSTGKLKEGDKEDEASLGYVGSSRPAWALARGEGWAFN